MKLKERLNEMNYMQIDGAFVKEIDGVYNECIKDKESVVIKPGYTNPKTFQ